MLGVSILPARRASALFPEWEFLLHKLDLVVTLVLDVVSDHVFIQPRRGHEVSSPPQCTQRELLRLLLDPSGRLPLNDLHGVRDGILWRYREVEVNVLIPHMPCVNGKMLPFRDLLYNFSQFFFY